MSYCLNSFKEGYAQDYLGEYYRGYEGLIRSLDDSSGNIIPSVSIAHPKLNPKP